MSIGLHWEKNCRGIGLSRAYCKDHVETVIGANNLLVVW